MISETMSGLNGLANQSDGSQRFGTTLRMTSSMTCSHHDVILLPIPFTDLTSHKVRPAIVVGFGTFPGDLFVVPITSQLANADFPLSEWRSAGLNVPCGVKGQLSTVEDRLVRRIVGRVSMVDATVLSDSLRRWLQL
jgi:mRNA interferase MazF